MTQTRWAALAVVLNAAILGTAASAMAQEGITPTESAADPQITATLTARTTSGFIVPKTIAVEIGEDMVAYTAEELTGFARDAWLDFQKHDLGTHRVSITNPAPEKKNPKIDSLTITPDLLTSLVNRLTGGGTPGAPEVEAA